MTEIKFTILEEGITVIKAADAAPQIEGQKLSPSIEEGTTTTGYMEGMHLIVCKRDGTALASKLDGGVCACPSADQCRMQQDSLTPEQAAAVSEAVNGALTDIAAEYISAEHIITDLEADVEAWHVRGKPPSSTPASGRRVLPSRRQGETFTLRHGNQNAAFTVTVGVFPDHAPAEVFIQGPKAGSEVEGIARDFAVVLSIALQYGAPIDVIRHSLTREEDGTPQTIAGKVVDAICNPQFNGPPTTEEGHG